MSRELKILFIFNYLDAKDYTVVFGIKLLNSCVWILYEFSENQKSAELLVCSFTCVFIYACSLILQNVLQKDKILCRPNIHSVVYIINISLHIIVINIIKKKIVNLNKYKYFKIINKIKIYIIKLLN